MSEWGQAMDRARQARDAEEPAEREAERQAEAEQQAQLADQRRLAQVVLAVRDACDFHTPPLAVKTASVRPAPVTNPQSRDELRRQLRGR